MIVVTGATGTVGRSLVELLAQEGPAVRAVSRDPRQADLPAGVDVVEGNPAWPDTLAPALEGATALFLHPRAVRDAADEVVARAREQGVTRVVALSAMNVDDSLGEQPSRLRGDRNKEAEDAAMTSGLEWTSLRAGFFALNTLHAWGAQIRAGDVVRYPHATFEAAPVHERDLAAVAAHALLTDDLVGRRPVLTGPQPLTHAHMVSIIGDVIGRSLRYEQISAEAAKQGMVDAGFPEPLAAAFMANYTRTVGQPAIPSGEVERILGRPAYTFAEWVADHVSAFRTQEQQSSR